MAVRAAVVMLALLAAADAHASARTLVLLHGTQPAAEDVALAQSVTIYTRDLDYEVQINGDVAPEITPDGLGGVVAFVRSAGARMAFWAESTRNNEAVLYAVGNINGRIAMNALRVRGLVGAELDRALALKVRAILTGAADIEPNEPLPVPKLAAAPFPPPAPPSPPPRVVYVQVAPPARPPERPRFRLATDYRLTLPKNPTLARHGVAIDASVPLGRFVELAFAVEVSSSVTQQISVGRVSLFDLPLRLAARARLERGRWRWLAGPVITLHVVVADGVGFDGSHGTSTRTPVGLGGELAAQLRLTPHMSADLHLLAEGLLSDEQFYLHGALALDAGNALFGIGAGLVFSAP